MLQINNKLNPRQLFETLKKYALSSPLTLLAISIGVLITLSSLGVITYSLAKSSEIKPLTIASPVQSTPVKPPTPTNSSTTKTPATTPTNNSSTAKPSAVQSPPPTAVPPPPFPACTKYAGWPQSIGPVNLGSATPGVVYIITDPTSHYQIYGYTKQDIYNQIRSCSPVLISGQIYFAETEYYTNFNYSYIDNGTSCSLTQPVVGVHFAQIFPTWNTSPYDSPGLDSNWASYLPSLVAFENGHVNIITQYADTLMNGLKNFAPAIDCYTLVNNANSYGNTIISEGLQADQSYDSTHGPTF